MLGRGRCLTKRSLTDSCLLGYFTAAPVGLVVSFTIGTYWVFPGLRTVGNLVIHATTTEAFCLSLGVCCSVPMFQTFSTLLSVMACLTSRIFGR